MTLRCSFTHHVQLDFFFLGKNGHHVSVAYAIDHYPNIGYQSIRRGGAAFTVHRRLRLFAGLNPYFRTYRSATLVVRVEAIDGDGLPAYATITARG